MEDHDLLIKIGERVENIYVRLFGEDSNPGEIESLKHRTFQLEDFKSKLIGALVLLSVITTSSVGALIYHLFTSLK